MRLAPATGAPRSSNTLTTISEVPILGTIDGFAVTSTERDAGVTIVCIFLESAM
jgi:hypothetical protein